MYSAYYAIHGGQIATLKVICQHEKFTAAHAHSTGPDGISLLGAAIQKNRLDMITYLMDEVQINPTKQCWNGGGNGLHACALWGTTSAIQVRVCESGTRSERREERSGEALRIFTGRGPTP